MVLGRFLWFFMGKNLQKLNWHGTDGTDMITTYKKKDIYRKWYEHGMSSPNKYRLGHRLL